MTVATLSVRGLNVSYGDQRNRVRAVAGADLELRAGEILGLAGESGCGKSTTALAMIGYRPPGSTITGGTARYGEADLLALPIARLRSLWGRRIGYVAQSAATALNPALTIGRQLAEPLRHHCRLVGQALYERETELIEAVGLPEPGAALERYPHQFSGGQQQRLAIAIALACRPDVLVLDEPTTGLDVTTQSRLSVLLRELVRTTGVAALYVSHDLALLGVVADRLAVMYAGEIVEHGLIGDVVGRPRHPYTRALLSALPSPFASRPITGIAGEPPSGAVAGACAFAPRCPHMIDVCLVRDVELVELGNGRAARCVRIDDPAISPASDTPSSVSPERSPRTTTGGSTPVLRVRDLCCEYRTNTLFAAVRSVSLDLHAGETLGIVGESGSGKSTLLRAIAGLHPRPRGTLNFRGAPLHFDAVRRPRAVRKEIQIVFQDPGSSLNPRQNVLQLIRRPIRLLRDDVSRVREGELIVELLEKVRLPRSMLTRYPWELSGGQRQRVAIARAFAADPSVLLCDEVTSALDVSVQAVVLEILADLAVEHGTAVVFVSHDLAVVRAVADRAIVMRFGEVCETAPTERLFTAPGHPYTAELLRAIPRLTIEECPEAVLPATPPGAHTSRDEE